MDKVILDGEDLRFVLEWVDENLSDLPKVPPRSLKEIKIKLTGLVDEDRKDSLPVNTSLTVKYKDPDIYVIKAYNSEGKRLADFKISYAMKQADLEMLQEIASLIGADDNAIARASVSSRYEIIEYNGASKEVVQLFTTIHYNVMCFFAYYKPKKIESEPRERKKKQDSTEEKKVVHTNKRDRTEHTVIFKEYLKVVKAGKSPAKVLGRKFAYAFRVRGHYRIYKSGKKVWIDEYKKGEGKNVNKTYRIEKKK